MNKRFLWILIILGLIILATATLTTNSPVTGGNYSGTMAVNCTKAIGDAPINATIVYLVYNASGGAVGTTALVTITNDSLDDTYFYNDSVLVSGLTDSATYNMTCKFGNATNNVTSDAVSGITIDNTAPKVLAFYNTTSRGNYSGTITLNVSVNDSTIGVESVWFNISYQNTTQASFSKASNISQYYSVGVDTSGFTDGNYTITVIANDTLGNTNSSESINVTIDNTAPTVSQTCSPLSVSKGATITCSCECSDALSGLSSACSHTTNPSTAATGTYTAPCNATDFAGNFGSDGDIYTVSLSGTGTIGGGGGKVIGENSKTWSKITSGSAEIWKLTDSALGLKQISISVNNPAQSVKITVSKYSGLPAAVTIEKTGKVYKYLHIETNNLENLSNAILTLKVNKSWIRERTLTRDRIALFKFNSTEKEWKEILTTYKEEDPDYDYYDAEVSSFSYFAIAEKEIPAETTSPPTTPATTPPTTTEDQGRGSTWLFLILTIIVIAAIVGGVIYWVKLRKA